MGKEVNTGDYDWTNKHLYYRWQILKRRKDYKAFCDKYSSAFNKEGLLEPFGYDDKNKTEIFVDEKEFEKIREKYGLDAIYHYETALERDDFIDYCVFEKPFATKVWSPDEKDDVLNAVWDERHIHIEVDIGGNITDGQLKDELLERVSVARADAGIQETSPEEISDEDLLVYDLHEEGKSHVEIIKEVWPEEYRKEWATSGAEEDKKYSELQRHYRNQGYEDWDTKAHDAVYETKEKKKRSGRIYLFMRVKDKVEKMRKLLKD
jgi:hypothetical protein